MSHFDIFKYITQLCLSIVGYSKPRFQGIHLANIY